MKSKPSFEGCIFYLYRWLFSWILIVKKNKNYTIKCINRHLYCHIFSYLYFIDIGERGDGLWTYGEKVREIGMTNSHEWGASDNFNQKWWWEWFGGVKKGNRERDDTNFFFMNGDALKKTWEFQRSQDWKFFYALSSLNVFCGRWSHVIIC